MSSARQLEKRNVVKLARFRLTLMLVGLMGIAGCISVSSSAMPPAAPTLALGHWEVVRQISYYNLPTASLKGDLGPAYLLYLVTLSGFHTDTFGLTAGPDDDVRYTTDGGQTWTKAASALHCRHGLEIVDEKVAWHCGNGGTRVSTDGGQTWQTVVPSACPYLSFLEAQAGWAASPYQLQATADGGATWTNVTLPPTAQNIATVALRTANDGYVLDIAGSLFVTVDGGKNWERRPLGLKSGEHLLTGASGPFAVMRFVDAQRGVVAFDLDDRTVWFAITQDGGQSWQRGEIPALRNQSYYYRLYLAREARLLTVTDDFNNGDNVSTVLRYQPP
jgi:photosystem II stability/assembly factor-like uncharacterized protein